MRNEDVGYVDSWDEQNPDDPGNLPVPKHRRVMDHGAEYVFDDMFAGRGIEDSEAA